MNMVKLCIVYLTVIFALTLGGNNISGQESWKQLAVVKSTRADVEKVLGKIKEKSIFERYELDEGMLEIKYSYGECGDELNGGWRLPEDTVIEIIYTPDVEIEFSTLKLNLKKYKKLRESPHTPQVISYANDEDGIKYVVQHDETISSIEYFPSVKYKHLRCEEK